MNMVSLILMFEMRTYAFVSQDGTRCRSYSTTRSGTDCYGRTWSGRRRDCCRTIDPDAGLHKITSPIVGTFYRSPGPDKDAYVSEGSNVSPESTVCIVEAMKLMNEIQAEVSGQIVKIYVQDVSLSNTARHCSRKEIVD